MMTLLQNILSSEKRKVQALDRIVNNERMRLFTRFGVVVSFLFFAVSLLSSGCKASKGPVSVQLAQLHALGQTLLEYASEHGGELPKSISAVADVSDPKHQYTDPKTHLRNEWLYFGASRKIDEKERRVLAAAPHTVHLRDGELIRLVLYTDGTCVRVSEAEFRENCRVQGLDVPHL
jgi:hypothetical protein